MDVSPWPSLDYGAFTGSAPVVEPEPQVEEEEAAPESASRTTSR